MTFKGFAQLENICKTTSEFAALNFASHNARVAALLNHEDSKNSIRDAAPHERKLFTLVDELGKKSRQELEQPPTPLRCPDSITVDKLLRAANVLAQICDLRDVKDKIETLAEQHEEITSSIDSLESIMEKQRINLEKLKITAQARNSKRSNDHQIDQSQNIADEIHCINMEIFALEMAKSECINRIYLIEDELNNQKFLEEEEKELNCRLGTMVLSDEPNDTEESEDLEQEELARLDDQFKELDNNILLQVDDSEFGRLKSKFQRFLTGTESKFNDPTNEKLKVQSVLSSSASVLDKFVEDQEKLNTLEYDNIIIKDVNDIMIDNCASEHNQTDIDTDALIPIPSQQTKLGAMVLQIIRDMDELTFSELKIKIGEAACKAGLSEDQGIRAIYTLLANQLITIDRSKGSYQPVRSDLIF
ncbi:hypothetical protein RclHR1_03330006 [Rhizophagus clarus]|uniref:Uncharacterized protein n=1 Tax=Rhizophagus clarus TaxID=94130 RepID=A0A2Z6RNU1_9GLOM|nr:hypothetical protein RclHR1_03330006 [Rhizophagus clarus]